MWDNEQQTVYRIEIEGVWSWVDFRAAHEQAYRLLEEHAEPVDLIVWVKTPPPPTGDALPNLRYTGGQQPDNVHRTVFVNEGGPTISFLIRAIDRAHGWVGPAIVNTLEGARDRLSDQDS